MELSIVEGPARLRDLSIKYLTQYSEINELERGIPFKELYYHSRIRNKELEYRIIKRITETKEHTEYLVFNSPGTMCFNRYADILPYKDTLVTLNDNQYINASFIDGTMENSENMFIATQGPLKATTDTFWSMI